MIKQFRISTSDKQRVNKNYSNLYDQLIALINIKSGCFSAFKCIQVRKLYTQEGFTTVYLHR